MEPTHPRDGDKGLLQYTVCKRHDDDGNVLFLIAEVYETAAGVDNHHQLATEDPALMPMLESLLQKCETIGGGASDMRHSLW